MREEGRSGDLNQANPQLCLPGQRGWVDKALNFLTRARVLFCFLNLLPRLGRNNLRKRSLLLERT